MSNFVKRFVSFIIPASIDFDLGHFLIIYFPRIKVVLHMQILKRISRIFILIHVSIKIDEGSEPHKYFFWSHKSGL